MRGAIRFEERGLEYKSIGSTVGVTSVSSIWYVSRVVKVKRVSTLVHQREADASPDRHQPGGDAPLDLTATSLLEPQTAHSSGESAGTQTRISQEDELAHTLEVCLSVFRSGLLQDIRIEGLVFCEPSSEDDPRSPPALQSLAIANAQFLEYRERIIKMFIDTLNLDCGRFERCRSIRDQLLDDIRNELIKLDKLKLHAWQMAPQNGTGHAMPTPSDPGPTTSISDIGSTRVVDTCECVGSISDGS